MRATCLSPEFSRSNSIIVWPAGGFRGEAELQQGGDAGGIVHAAGPAAAAGVLQGGPQVCVGRDVRVRLEARMERTLGELRRRYGNGLDGPFEFTGIDAQPDDVA